MERALPLLLGQQWTSLESMSLADKLQVTPLTAVCGNPELSFAVARWECLSCNAGLEVAEAHLLMPLWESTPSSKLVLESASYCS